MNFLSRIDWCNKSTSSFFYGLLVHGWLGVNINAKKKKKSRKASPNNTHLLHNTCTQHIHTHVKEYKIY